MVECCLEAWEWGEGEEFGFSGANMEEAILSPRRGLIVQSWTWGIGLLAERDERQVQFRRLL